tara:strand:+ start:4570 stop:5529 length:960 start_codon:yes stop_codon:yes gene_type:complete
MSGNGSVAKTASEKQRQGFNFETIKGCGLGKPETHTKTGPKTEFDVEDWKSYSDDNPRAEWSKRWRSLGAKTIHQEGTKYRSTTLRVRYERAYSRIRGGKIDKHGECWASGSFAGSATETEAQPCLGIKDAGAVEDIVGCARPDGQDTHFWEPIIDYKVAWSGEGVPAEASECGRGAPGQEAHLSFNSDSAQGPRYRFFKSRENAYGRDDTCEQYKIEASGPISTMFKNTELSAKDVIYNDGPLYFHACGKTTVVPEETRLKTREQIDKVDKEVDGIYANRKGWEPITNFYDIPENESAFKPWMCLRASDSEDATWWPW